MISFFVNFGSDSDMVLNVSKLIMFVMISVCAWSQAVTTIKAVELTSCTMKLKNASTAYPPPMIRTTLILLTVSLSLMAEEKWIPMFDGKSTQGWGRALGGDQGGGRRAAFVFPSQCVGGERTANGRFRGGDRSDDPAGKQGLQFRLGFRLIGDEGKPKGYQCE